MLQVAVVLFDRFELVEGTFPIAVGRRLKEDLKLTVLSVGPERVSASQGLAVIADRPLDYENDTFDVVILPGGPGSFEAKKNARFVEFIKRQKQSGAWLCAICASPFAILKECGVLGDAKAVCYPSLQPKLGENLLDAATLSHVDREAKIITSQGPGTAWHFAFTLYEEILGKRLTALREAMVIPK